MRCAVSFLSVLTLTTGVGIAAFFIIWSSDSQIELKPSANFTCRDSEWKCKEYDLCIPATYRCNHVKECPLGSDENPVDCNDMSHTVDFIVRELLCGQGKNVTQSEATLELADGCSKKERWISCRDRKWGRVPWEKLDLHVMQLTLDNVMNFDELTDELVPPANNTINKLFFDNNTIMTLGKGSICNWEHACWMTFINNSIQNMSMGAFCNQPKLSWLTMSYNKLTLENFRFPDMPKLQALSLDHNEIEIISDGVFRRLKNLKSLYLMQNKIKTIEERAFRYNINLTHLDLSGNMLKQLSPLVFDGQSNLVKLSLEFNPFELLQGKVFSKLESLSSLNLDGVELSAIDFDGLSTLSKLDYVRFKKFGYCRYFIKATRCYPFSDGVSSILNLLAGRSFRWIVWIVAIFTLVGNSIVLITRCVFSGRGRILDVFINNLAGADLLMGIYLVTVAIKDIQYRNAYKDFAYEWSTSFLCSGIGIIAMISCEASLLILTFMSVERYLVISDPFSYHKKLSLNLSRISMMIIWIFVTVLAVAPAIQWRGKFSFYGSSGLCFPVHLDEPFAIGWQYTTFVIVGLNSACLIIVAISYSKLFCVIRTTRLSTPIDTKDIEMAVRLFLMVFTDCLCWLPLIFLKIYALGGNQIPKEVITWAVIFVLPINSSINPYLYTLSMPEIRIKFFRRIIPTSTFRPSLNMISLPFRRHGATITVTDTDSRATWGDGGTNATTTLTTASNNKKIVPRKGRLSYQESFGSSKIEDTL